MVLSLQKEQARIKTASEELEGLLWLPEDASGVVVFANAGRSHRLRLPGDYLASALREARLATLSLDLSIQPPAAGQDPPEAPDATLTRRLRAACDWLGEYRPTADLPLGLCGVGHGAGAVMLVAAGLGRRVCALVARGTRPERATIEMLPKVSAPTLLIVGGLDEYAADRNRVAYAALRCRKRFEIIPGATQAFDEPGSLEVVARLARNWFVQHVHYATI